MSRTPSEVKNNVNFMLEFDRHGWSRFHIFEEKASQCFWVSDVFSEFLSDMLLLCEHLLSNEPVRIALCDEPGGVVIALKPIPKQQHTVEIIVEEISGSQVAFGAEETGKQVFQAVMKRKQVIANLMADLWKINYLLQDPSYQKDRDTFPHKHLHQVNRAWHESDLGPSFLK